MSWKQYGGLRNHEINNTITTNTIIADDIILKKAYYGGFTINGVLNVDGQIVVRGNTQPIVSIYGSVSVDNVTINNDLDVSNNSRFYQNVTVYGNTSLRSNLDVLNNTTINNDLSLNNNMYLGNILYLNRNKTQFIYGNVNGNIQTAGIGINTMNPTAAFDICANRIEAINVYSTQSKNRNIIAQNNSNHGIVVSADVSSSYIDFYNDLSVNSTVSDARIQYKKGGILQLDVSKNTQIMSQVSISDRGDGIVAHINDEPVVIYDLSNGIYKYDVFNKSNTYTGSALSLIANDVSSNTFLNITTPNKMGSAYGGGAYPKDTSRSMGTIGVVDVSGYYIASQTFVSGNSHVKYKTTLGINTYNPQTEKYVLEVNGPLHIDNGDVHIINTSNFEIKAVGVSRINPSIVMAVGTSIDVSGSYKDISGNNNYRKQILVSKDYGNSWKQIDITNAFGEGNNPINYTLNDIFVYDASYAFIAASGGKCLFTINGGNNWYSFTFEGTPVININFKNINVIITGTAVHAYLSNETNIYYFNTNKEDLNGTIISLNQTLSTQTNALITDGTIQSMIAVDINTIYIATNKTIKKYNVSDIKSPTLQSTFPAINTSYNFIDAVDDFIVAVGDNIITTSRDGGSTSTNLNGSRLTGISFKSVYVYNSSNAIAVGGKNLWVTTNSGIDWNPISSDIINCSGKENILLDTTNQFAQVVISDANTVLLANTIHSYDANALSGFGKSSFINCFLPKLFNRANNNVLDLCGNMIVSGDIRVNNDGKIMSNNTDFYILNENVNNIYFGRDASNIQIGNTYGNTHIRHNLDVSLNSTLHGLLDVYGIETVRNTTNSDITSNGALVVSGGVGIARNTNIGGQLNVASDSSFNGNVLMKSITSSTNSSSGAVIISGGVGIGGNTNIGGQLNVTSDSSFNGNVLMKSTTDSTNNSTGALIVTGGVGIARNTNIGGQLNVTSDSSFNGIVLMKSMTDSTNTSTGAVIVTAGVGIGGNTNIGGQLNVASDSSFNGIVLMKSMMDSTNSSTGAVIVTGGVGISKNTNIGGQLNVALDSSFNGMVLMKSDMSSNNITSGALVISGGVGIGGNTNIGGKMNVALDSSFNGKINIGGQLRVDSDSSFNGNINIGGKINVASDSSFNGIVRIQSDISSNDITNGALIIRGGVGIGGNVNVGGQLRVDSDSSFNGIVRIKSDISSNSITSGAIIVSGGVGIGGNTNIGGQLKVGMDSSFNGSVFVNSNITSDSINTGNLTTSGNTVFNGDINVSQINGKLNGTSNQITIGQNSNRTSTITIGGLTDTIYIKGNLYTGISSGGTGGSGGGVFGSTTTDKVITVNADLSGIGFYGSSQGSGIYIWDNSINKAGQIIVSDSLDGFVFQAPTRINLGDVSYASRQNKLKLEVNSLVNSPDVSYGLVILKKTENTNDANYTMTSAPIDISNIFLKSKDSSTYPNTQTIQTNLRITGDTYFIGKSYVSNQILVGKDSGITNTSIDISGNTIVSRLGIGTTSVNANPNSLDISGNIYQMNGGFIWQF